MNDTRAVPTKPATPAWAGDQQLHAAVLEAFRYHRCGPDFFRRKCSVGIRVGQTLTKRLEEIGIVGPERADHGPREFRMTWDQWLAWLAAHGVAYRADDPLYCNPVP